MTAHPFQVVLFVIPLFPVAKPAIPFTPYNPITTANSTAPLGALNVQVVTTIVPYAQQDTTEIQPALVKHVKQFLDVQLINATQLILLVLNALQDII